MIQFSLPVMLELVDEGVLTLTRLVALMCHNPASLFEIRDRGYLQPGYKADITVVKPNSPWEVTKDVIQSKCKWSPLSGHRFNWQVKQTFCNGHLIYDEGHFDSLYRGEQILFR